MNDADRERLGILRSIPICDLGRERSAELARLLDLARSIVVPLDATWPTHCGQPMWFRGGAQPKFYCDCGHERPPLPTEVRVVT